MSTLTNHGDPAALALTEHRGFALLTKLETACQKTKVRKNIEKCKNEGSKADLEQLITDVVIKSGVLEDYDFEETREGIAMMNSALRNWLTLVPSSAEDKVSKHFTMLSLMEQVTPATPGFLTSSSQKDTTLPSSTSEDSVKLNLTDAETDLPDEEERPVFEPESSEEFVRESSTDTQASEKIVQLSTDVQVTEVPSDLNKLPAVRLNFEDAMALLTELRNAYLAEEFKEEKAMIDNCHTCEIEEEYLDDLGAMVMRELHFIFPKYGFQKNLRGAAQFKASLGKLLLELAEKDSADEATLKLGLEKWNMMMPFYGWLLAKDIVDPNYNLLRLPQVPMLGNRRKEPQVHQSSMLVPKEKVEAIIGKQGESRRQIEVQSRARLTFHDDEADKFHQKITINCDTFRGVQMAFDLIKERMQQNAEDEKPKPTKVWQHTVLLKNFGAKEEKIKIKIDAVERPTVARIKQAVAEKLGDISSSELEVVFDMFNGQFIKKVDTEKVGDRVIVRKVAGASENKKPIPLTELTKMIASVNDALHVL